MFFRSLLDGNVGALLTDFNGRTILITGANGFLGRHLIARLQNKGARICAISRTKSLLAGSVDWREGDLTHREWLETTVAEIRPDIIYHLASASQGGQEARYVMPAFENDLRTTVHTLLAAQACGCPRVILVASLEEPVFGGRPFRLSSPYAAAKSCCTFYGLLFHQLYGVPVTILRPFMAYGPGQKEHKLIPHTILALLKGESPRLSSGVRPVDWVYVDDVITAFLDAALRPEAEGAMIDLGSGTLVTVRALIEQIHSLIPGSPPPAFGALPDRRDEVVRCAETGTALRLLGWKVSTPLSEGLAKTIDSYRSDRQP